MVKPGILLLLLVLQLQEITGASVKATIKEATSRTTNKPSNDGYNALDGDFDTYYHSDIDNQPEWLKLTLAKASKVEKVVIVNRYTVCH